MQKALTIVLCIVLICMCGCSGNNVSDVSLTTDNYNAEEDPFSKYAQIVSYCKDWVEFRLSESFEKKYNSGNRPSTPDELRSSIDRSEELTYRWNCMIIEMTSGMSDVRQSSFGYIYEDINDDDIPEMFFVRKDYTILAVFTLQNNGVQLLDAYWPRYNGVVLSDDSICVRSSAGASYTKYQIKRISKDGVLSVVQEFGIDGLSEDGVALSYYEIVSGKKNNISQTRFNELKTLFPFQMKEDWRGLPFSSL